MLYTSARSKTLQDDPRRPTRCCAIKCARPHLPLAGMLVACDCVALDAPPRLFVQSAQEYTTQSAPLLLYVLGGYYIYRIQDGLRRSATPTTTLHHGWVSIIYSCKIQDAPRRPKMSKTTLQGCRGFPLRRFSMCG